MSAKITQQDRETAIRITRGHKVPTHLVEEWKTREAPLRPFLEEMFKPLIDSAQALADARAEGYRRAMRDVQQCRCSVGTLFDAIDRVVRDGGELLYKPEEEHDETA